MEALETERKRAEGRIEHLNLVLRAIRSVNQLVVRGWDRDRLLQGVCDSLIETRGYYNAWITLLDESGGPALSGAEGSVTSAEAGLGEDFLPMVEQLKRGELTACGQRAMRQANVIAIEDPASTCADCPLAKKYGSRGAMTVRLEHGGNVYGLLSVSIPRELIADEEEQALFREVAGDIAFALHAIELEEERKRAEEALRESEKKFRDLMENVPIGISISTPDGKVTEVNAVAVNMFGYDSKEGFLRVPASAHYYDQKDRERFIKLHREGFVKDFEARFERKDGTVFWCSITSITRATETGAIQFINAFQDVTERKQMEEALRKQAHDLGERVKELNCLYDISGLVEKPGLSLGEILQGAVALIPPAWQYPEITGAQIITLEGQEFRTENFRATVWKQIGDIVVRGERIGTVEVCYLEEKPEGEEGPFLTEERDLINAIAEQLGRIIERMQAEEELREHRDHLGQLVEARTAELEAANEELSQYAYAVSHDLKTPLRAIHNYADFLREDLEATLAGDQKAYLDGLGRAVRESEALVEGLLALSRIGRSSIPIEMVDVGVFLRRLLAILSLPADVEVVMADEWPTIVVEPVLVGQVFQNLISNAVKFNTSPHKRVELGWRPASLLLPAGGTEGGPQAYEFFVRDNGIGIDPRYHEQIFHVFERLHTSEEYEGTGIGLAIVKKAINKLGGAVRVESKPGEGSTFFVTLPGTQKER